MTTRRKSTGTRAFRRWTVRAFAFIALLAVPFVAASCAGSRTASRGDEYFQRGLYDRAIEQYRLAVAENPDKTEYRARLELAIERAAEYHFERGRRLLAENKLKDAANAFETAVQYRPDYDEAKDALESTTRLISQITFDIKNGRKLVSEKRWFEAIECFAKLRKYSADFPEIEKVHTQAVDGAYAGLMNDGLGAYREERFDDALALFTRARELKPKESGAGQMMNSTRRQIAARRFYRAGEALLEAGNFRGAITKFEAALLQAPAHAGASKGLARAKQVGAKALFDEGKAALEANKPASAVTAFNEAMGYAPDLEGLAESAKRARGILGEKLYERGVRYERTKSDALAYLCFRQTEALAPEIAGLKGSLLLAQTKINAHRSYVVFLAGKSKDKKLTRRVLTGSQRILSGTGASVFGPEEAKALTQRNPNLVPDAVLTISGGEPSISRPSPSVERKSKRYITGKRFIENPSYRETYNVTETYRLRLNEIDHQRSVASRKARRLHRERDITYRRFRDAADDDPKKPELKRRYLRAKRAYEKAGHRLSSLDTMHHRTSHEYNRQIHTLHGTPRLITVNEYATYTYKVVTKKISGRISATYRVVDTLLCKEMFQGTVVVEHGDTDKVVEGYEKAGVEADPDELMTNEEMREYLKNKLASRFVLAVSGALRRHPNRYLDMAEKAKAAGDTDRWLDNLALYILTGGDDSGRLRETDTLLRKNIGYSIRAHRINYSALKQIIDEK